MTFRNREYFTVVELGTSKICVVHCLGNEEKNPEIIGFGIRECSGIIVKGEIIDLKETVRLLSEAFGDADKLASDGAPDRGNVYFLVSGPAIRALSGTGNVEIFGEESVITAEHVNEAIRKAMAVSLAEDRVNIDTLTSYFVMDSGSRVQDPVGHTAHRLDAYVHLITADRNRLETIRAMLHEIGFEGSRTPIFSGSAAAFGSLNSDEKELGGLLIDIGAGITEFEFVQDNGVLASGVLPVGMDNLANDLSIMLNIPIDQGRRIVAENTIDFMQHNNQPYLEIPSVRETPRQLPLSMMEDVANKRMIEIFTLIRDELGRRSLLPRLRGGVVLTGGGTLFKATKGYAESVFSVPCRIGNPSGISGAVTGLDSPRFSTLTGALKYVIELESMRTEGSINRIGDLLEGLTGGVFERFKNLTKVFRK